VVMVKLPRRRLWSLLLKKGVPSQPLLIFQGGFGGRPTFPCSGFDSIPTTLGPANAADT
jgi:hypothetical protein